MSFCTSGRILQAYPFRSLRRPLFRPSSASSLFVTESLPVVISLISLTWGSIYVLISAASLPSLYLLLLILPLSLCFTFRRPSTAYELQWQHWALLWDILGLHFEIFLGCTLKYSWALLWDILGLYFEIFLGSTLRYTWAPFSDTSTPLLDIRGVQC